MDKLNKDEAYGILKNLSREEVLGLTKHQIDTCLKYGISHSDVEGLNEHQIIVFLALRKDNIQSIEVRQQAWLQNPSQVSALFYLMRVQNYSFMNACDELKNLYPNEARGISYGLEKNKVIGLDNVYISLLIKKQETDGLGKREDVVGLKDYQINLVKRFYHFGLTSAIARNLVESSHFNLVESFNLLILEKGICLNEVLSLISGLNESEIYGVSLGFSKEEVCGLNEFQIKALGTCKTIKNELSMKHFLGKDWFNSDKHVNALNRMLMWNEFTVEEAMQGLDGLTGDQAEQISEGKKRDNIVGLNKYQLRAIDKLQYRGLKGSDLRGHDWFNSDNHVAVLEHFVKKGLKIEEVITQIKDLNTEQLNLSITSELTLEEVLKLTPTQIALFRNRYEYGLYDVKALLNATWLNTEDEMKLLKKICKVVADTNSALAMVKFASEKNQAKEILEKIEMGTISSADLRKTASEFNMRLTGKTLSFYASPGLLFSGTSTTTANEANKIQSTTEEQHTNETRNTYCSVM